MALYHSILDNIRTKVNGFLSRITDTRIDGVPKQGDELVGTYIDQLFDDAEKYRNNSFKNTGSLRKGFADFMEWGKALLKMEAGQHWEVFGTRKKAADDNNPNWMAEVVDDGIQDQISVRNSHLTGSWHEIQVMPNIQNINEILNQERKKTGWGKLIRKASKMFQIYGDGWVESFFDRSEYPEGVASERVLEYGSLLLNPYATGVKKNEGGRYAIIAEMVTGQQVEEDFPKFDIENAATIDGTRAKKISLLNSTTDNKEYMHTKLYARLRCYMDDSTLEPADFSPEECEMKWGLLLQGEEVKVNESDNHEKYVEMYRQYAETKQTQIEQIIAEGQMTDEDRVLADSVMELINVQIEEHLRVAADLAERGISVGRKKKYPNGRMVVTIDGKVAKDVPNPYPFDWRCLLHRIPNEEVIGRFDGRGDVEKLWNNTRRADEMLSRHEDEITLSFPRKVRSINDKQLVDKDGETNDPTVTDWYVTTPPIYQSRQVTGEALRMYEVIVGQRKDQLGITDVTRGESPTATASGDLAEILVQQNQIQISGEANNNLNDGVESIVETKLMIMRAFYKELRPYMINGVETLLNVSRMLSSRAVQEDGQDVEKEVGRLEVSVRPDSNSPMKWERDISFITKLAQTLRFPDGAPVVPMEAVQDMLSERYPEFGRNGKYAQISQATAVGMQVIQQQEQQKKLAEQIQKKDQNDLDSVRRGFSKKLASQELAQNVLPLNQ